MNTIKVALKEWHLVIQAMLNGKQAILLRKGGILESNNEFELEHRRFLLFPTYIHQNPAHTKAEWRDRIQGHAQEPAKVTIEGFGETLRIVEVPSRAAMDRLFDLHVWDTPLIDMRFNYRPEKPLYVVVVKAFRLAAPVTLENTAEYAGCKSWVPLSADVDIAGATQAMEDEKLQALTARVAETLKG